MMKIRALPVLVLLCLLCLLLPATAAALEIIPMETGAFTLQWEAAETDGAYCVFLQHQPEGMAQLIAQVESPACSVRDILPGEAYQLWVTDAEGTELDRCEYEAPEAVYQGFPIKAIITPKSHTSRGYTELRTFSASDIAANLDTTQYGAGLRLTHSPLRTARTFLLSFAVFLPNGDSYYCGYGTHTMPVGRSSSVISFDDYSVMFRYILNSTGAIPTGTWRYAVYCDGLLAAETTFEVRP